MTTSPTTLLPSLTTGRHVFSVLVENQHGVLSRVSGMLASRGYNIDSLTVSPTEDPSMSRMTVCFLGEATVSEQIRKQLMKMAEVVVVEDVVERPHVERELMLLKIRHAANHRTDLLQIAQTFKAKSVDMTPDTITFQIVGNAAKLSNFLDMILQDATVVEIARSGIVALARGPEGLREGFLGKTLAS